VLHRELGTGNRIADEPEVARRLESQWWHYARDIDRLPPDFMRALMADFRKHRKFEAPWNRRLKSSILKSPVHYWIEDDEIDLEAHLRHTALPWPGGERELGELIARLHSQPLDLSRPPWECTLIEGLEGGRFAMYIKMHHSLIDGVSGMKLLQRAMSADREKRIKDLFQNTLSFQKQQRYEEALGQLEMLLAIDPQNNQALIFKQTLEDMISFRKQLEIEKERGICLRKNLIVRNPTVTSEPLATSITVKQL
jgi:tetratricopeptide (TPR) repeat protein